ncbi:hypothetical protein [Blautia caecimuris]
MKKRKTLQDLTIKDNFMFGAVMRRRECCGSIAGACQVPGICNG